MRHEIQNFRNHLKVGLKVGCFATLYYSVLGFVYVTLISSAPESFPLKFSTDTPVTAPEIVVPALFLLAWSVIIAYDAHLYRVKAQ